MKLSEVLWYTEQHGFKHPLPVLPLVPRDKIPPSGTHGYKSATLNAETIRNWWCENQDYNLGVGTGKQGGIVVIDVDEKPWEGKFGFENKEALEDELGALPETWTVLSGGGGRHLYYRYPDGVDDIPSTIGEIAPNIDVKADRGYAVLPPSIHGTTGRAYTWEMSLHPEDTPIADLPQAWVDVLTGKRKTWYQQQKLEQKKEDAKKQGVSADRFVLPDVIQKGLRNDTLFRYACSLRRKGKTYDEVMALVMRANEEKAKPPVPVREVRGMVKSAMSYDDGTTDSSKYTPFAEKNNSTTDTQKQVSEVTKNEVSEVPPEEDPKGDFEVFEPDMGIDPVIDPFLGDLSRFHKYRKKKPVGVIDEVVCNSVMETEDFFFLGSGQNALPFFFKDGVFTSYSAEALLAEAVEKRILTELRTAPTISRICRRFGQKTACLARTDDLDSQPGRYIHFANGYYDPLEKKMLPHDPKYKTTVMIPYEFDPEEKTEGKKVDEWLKFAFPEDDARECFLQYLGYCLTWDTSQKKFLWLTGRRDSGKSMIGDIVALLVGEENRATIFLEELTSSDSSARFSRMELFGKLVAPISEPNTAPLENLGLLKRITGGDKITAEKKGADRISFFCRTKFVISSNVFPRIHGETTDAFYHRGLFLRMDQVPEEIDRNFLENVIVPNRNHLTHLAVDAVSRMYQDGGFKIPQCSLEETKAVFSANDPVQRWLDACVVMDESNKDRVRKTDAYKHFKAFCERENVKKEDILSSPEWVTSLRDKGLYITTWHGYACLPMGYRLQSEQ